MPSEFIYRSSSGTLTAVHGATGGTLSGENINSNPSTGSGLGLNYYTAFSVDVCSSGCNAGTPYRVTISGRSMFALNDGSLAGKAISLSLVDNSNSYLEAGQYIIDSVDAIATPTPGPFATASVSRVSDFVTATTDVTITIDTATVIPAGAVFYIRVPTD